MANKTKTKNPGIGEAHKALHKLLIKLELLDSTSSLDEAKHSDQFPIAYFSGLGFLEEPDALRIISNALKVPLFTFESGFEEQVLALLDHKKIEKISLERWKFLRVIPIEITASYLQVAMANPLDQDAKKGLEFDLGTEIKIGIASEAKILELITRKLNSSPMFDLDSILEKAEVVSNSRDDDEELQRLESNVASSDVSSTPVVHIINKIFLEAIQRLASDIHLSPEKRGLTVKIRVDGILQPLFTIPDNLKNHLISRVKVLCGMDISERRKPQDGRLRVKSGFGLKDLRISTIPTVYGENIVARILSSELTRVTFESLGMSPTLIKQYSRVLGSSSRVILVSGPTGSGKTSTLYTSILQLRDGTSNIITIEDPIEYRFDGVNQIQVNAKNGVTFADGLRSILRQDPDIIMVGEIRDPETAEIAMQIAQTGHLVLSTVHANTAAASITRLRDLKVPSYLLASSLGAVMAQRLVRKLCEGCKIPLDGPALAPLAPFGVEAGSVYQAKGCNQCNNTGYRGRIGVFSFIEVNDSVREAIRSDCGEAEIEQCARENNFITLDEYSLDLLRNGITTVDEIEDNIAPLEIIEGLISKNPRSKMVQSKAAEHRAAASDQATPSSGITKRKILLVEDEETTRTVLGMLLRSEMFEVDEAENGQEALEKIYCSPPALILSDLMMPKMTGLEMVKRLKADARTRAIPVLLLTAADSEENELQSINGGADDFISKTAGSKIMLARIHRLLERLP